MEVRFRFFPHAVVELTELRRTSISDLAKTSVGSYLPQHTFYNMNLFETPIEHNRFAKVCPNVLHALMR